MAGEDEHGADILVEHLAREDTLIQLGILIVLLPFLTGGILIFLRLYELRKGTKLSESLTGYIGTGSLGVSWIASLWLMGQYFNKYVEYEGDGHWKVTKVQAGYEFMTITGGSFHWGLLLDPLSVIFLVALTTIATSIHLYSTEYMHGEPGYTRFFGTMNFFTGSMLGFVLSSNLFMGFIFWELLGFSSYLLIGYYWEKPSASSAAKKAFLYNKVGDVSFVIGIALIYQKTAEIGEATLDYVTIQNLILNGELHFSELWIPAMLIFGAAIGKSAQFPLFGWLPEAMEGPTPVSSLLHSSTMVKAGLFLVARNFFLYYQVDDHLLIIEEVLPELHIVNRSFHPATFVLWIGVITALCGALMALTTRDIKRVLAFSTISQLGYIAAALGSGGLTPGLYHIISHATFKSLLFLCAGSVIHAVHSQEYDDMGALKKYMPWTYRTTTVGLLGLSGFPFMNGFWSKDAVLLAIHENKKVAGAEFAYWLAVLTAGITAFYCMKMWVLTFYGDDHYDEHHKPHESKSRMIIPLVVLGLLVAFESIWWSLGTIFGGKDNFIANLFGEDSFFNFEYALGSVLGVHGGKFEWIDALPSILAVSSGYAFAYFMYFKKTPFLVNLKTSRAVRPLENAVTKRFWLDIALYWVAENPVMWVGEGFKKFDERVIDEFMINSFVRDTIAMGGAEASDWFDRTQIDGFVNWVGLRFRDLGFELRRLQKGKTPMYARLMSLGVLVILSIFTYNNFFA